MSLERDLEPWQTSESDSRQQQFSPSPSSTETPISLPYDDQLNELSAQSWLPDPPRPWEGACSSQAWYNESSPVNPQFGLDLPAFCTGSQDLGPSVAQFDRQFRPDFRNQNRAYQMNLIGPADQDGDQPHNHQLQYTDRTISSGDKVQSSFYTYGEDDSRPAPPVPQPQSQPFLRWTPVESTHEVCCTVESYGDFEQSTPTPPLESNLKWVVEGGMKYPTTSKSPSTIPKVPKRKLALSEPKPKKASSESKTKKSRVSSPLPTTQRQLSEFVVVFENAPGALANVKRRRRLDGPVRKAAKAVRKAGACHQCRFRKRTVSL